MSTSIDVTIDGVKAVALLDGGSPTTMMDLRLAKNCNMKWKKVNDGRTWKAAGGHRLNVMGSVIALFKIGPWTFEDEVIVVDGLVHQLLIGTDIMRPRRFTIDYGRKLLCIDGRSTPIRVPGRDVPARIAADYAITIPARSEGRIYLRCPDGLGEAVLVENGVRQTNRSIADGLHPVDTHGVFSVRVLNRRNTPFVIRRGTVLCGVSGVKVEGQVVNDLESAEETVMALEQETFKPSITANIGKEMSKEWRGRYEYLLDSNADVFSRDDDDIGNADIEHSIRLTDCKPFKARAYRIPMSQQRTADEHVKAMLKANVIRPSTSEYASPIVLIRKSDGSIRFCVDYRKLNAATVKDNYPMPLIEERLNSIFGSAIFSGLDMTSGYWQFRMAESSVKLTAFICQSGLYEFVRMPFGLCNAGATFQRAMNQMLSGLQFALAYIDDVLCHSRNHAEHLEHLSQVFQRLREAKLKIKLRKCQFGYLETKFLGYIISAKGIRMNPEKIAAIRDYPQPKSAKQARKWNGITSQYRQFIPSYPNINEPLQEAALLTTKDLKTKKRVKAHFEWTEACQAAFDTLKEILTRAPIMLVHPDCSKKFRLITDASKVGLGAILVQVDDDGIEKVVCFAGRVLLDAEKNYSASERELLAIKWAVRKFRCYLYGVAFEVFTDHKPLTHMKTCQNPSDRMLKWILELEEYNATYFYRPGKLNVEADVLSRVAEKAEDETDVPLEWYARKKSVEKLKKEQKDVLEAKPKRASNSDSEDEIAVLAVEASDEQYRLVKDEVNKRMLTEAQWQDQRIQIMIERLSSCPDSAISHAFKQDSDGTLYLQDKINKTWRLVIPREYTKHVLSGCHDDIGGAHLGRMKTLNKVAQRFYWIGMAKDVANWVASCKTCASRKSSRRSVEPELVPLPTVENPFDRVAVDYVGPLKSTARGNKYILVFVDYATRWPEAFATGDMTATTVANLFVTEILCRHGAPVELLSDRGQNFLSKIVAEICQFTRTRKVNTSAYHPQTNGLCERFNGTIIEALAAYADENQSNWDLMLPIALFGCRVARQTTTERTPASLLYARELRLPLDVDLYLPKLPFPCTMKQEFQRAQQCIQKSGERAKAKHDRANNPYKYQVGDLVRARLHTAKPGISFKLGNRWSEPVRVVAVGTNTVGIMTDGKLKYVSQIHVKPAESERQVC
jgi:hypothetical protein